MNRADNLRVHAARLATAENVLHVLGPVDNSAVARILAMQPTYQDLTEVALRVRGDGDLVLREARELSASVLAVAAILSDAEESELPEAP